MVISSPMSWMANCTEPCFEKVSLGPLLFATHEWRDSRFKLQLHYHSEYELTLILHSRGLRLVGDGIAEYGPGDLVLLGPNVPHSWCSGAVRNSARQTHHAVVTHFNAAVVSKRLLKLRELSLIESLLERSTGGLAFGHTNTGSGVASRLGALPVLSPTDRLASLLDALVNLSSDRDAQVLSPSVAQRGEKRDTSVRGQS